MQEFVSALNENYRLDGYKIKAQTVILKVSSMHEELMCPYCNVVSKRVHSTYEREVQDLPEEMPEMPGISLDAINVSYDTN